MTTTARDRHLPTTTPPASAGRGAAIITASAPALLLATFLWHPPIPGRLPDAPAVAEAAASGLTRWGMVHLATVVTSALVAVAFVAVHELLRAHGGNPSLVGVGAIVMGSVLYAVLPSLEMAQLAAHETGADMAATQEALTGWFRLALLSSGLAFLVGAIAVAVAVNRAALFGGGRDALVATALVLFAMSRLVPVGAVQFYVQAAMAVLALLPLAVQMWIRSPAR
jgi:hypothetical protein